VDPAGAAGWGGPLVALMAGDRGERDSDSVRDVPWVVRHAARAGLLLLVSASGCLLYTDRVNAPPVVEISAGEVHPGTAAIFRARAQDPDGDAMTFRWWHLDRPCGLASADEWARVTPVDGDPLSVTPGHDRFCVRLMARDSSGAEATAIYDANPLNRPPDARIDVIQPIASADAFPLYSLVQLSAAHSTDPDGDDVSYVWQVRDAAGAEIPVVACAGPESACFTAAASGPVAATVVVNDGWSEGRTSVNLTIAADQPPCIEATDPTVDTPTIVLAVTDPPRRFEVRQARDDGHPFPPGPLGGTSFRWYLGRETGPWTRQLGYDSASFDVSAARFDDARPGSVYRVRVEARDPAHDDPSTLRDLEGCGDDRVCERPPRCVRWVGWKVQLR
jgi:hypothetical protein